jgi:hypothetical protein
MLAARRNCTCFVEAFDTIIIQRARLVMLSSSWPRKVLGLTGSKLGNSLESCRSGLARQDEEMNSRQSREKWGGTNV